MNDVDSLKALIKKLQEVISQGGINAPLVEEATTKLSALGFAYDSHRFPALVDTVNFVDESCGSPSNLAEALLWKLGKWNSYKKFANHYTDDKAKPTKNDVVFFAFARHLKNKENPIYDQHAIRALWAIRINLNEGEKKSCESLLFNGKREWKQAGSGADSIKSYELFTKHVSDLVGAENGPTLEQLDRLLMPLGQAIKDSTKTLADFNRLCGLEVERSF